MGIKKTESRQSSANQRENTWLTHAERQFLCVPHRSNFSILASKQDPEISVQDFMAQGAFTRAVSSRFSTSCSVFMQV